MSVEVMSWVLHHSPESGTRKVVLLGIANHCDPDGDNAWPSIDTLATYARVSRSAVQRAIAGLVESGALVVDRNGGGTVRTPVDRRPNRYRIVMARGSVHATPQDTDGVASTRQRGSVDAAPRGSVHATDGVASALPETSIETSIETSMKRPTVSDVVDLIWQSWPTGRKIDKPATTRAVSRAIRDGHSPAAISEGIDRDAAVWATWPASERQFVPHPATWVNGRRWTDDPPAPRQTIGSRRDRQVDDLGRLAAEAATVPTFAQLLDPGSEMASIPAETGVA